MTGFCLRCRTQRDVPDAAVSKSARIGRVVFKGACPVCRHVIYRISNLPT